MPLKFTIGFAAPGWSWTEAHYNAYNGSPADATAISLAGSLAAARVACLAQACSILKVRISSVPANRLVWDLFPPFIAGKGQLFIGLPGFGGAGGFSSMIPGGVLLLDLFSGNSGQTRIFLGGVPSGIFSMPGVGNAGYDLSGAPGFDIALASYIAYLTLSASAWGFLSSSLPQAGSVVPASQGLVTNAQYPNSVGIVTQNGALAALPPGTQVLTRGWHRLSLRSPPLGGVYRTLGQTLISSGPPSTWTYFLQNTGTVQPSNFFSLGKIGLLNQVFLPYTKSQIVGATTRKRGSRFGAHRGRSSIRT